MSRSSPQPPHEDTRSSSLPSFNPFAIESITPSSPESANGLVTPPATPQKKKDTNGKASNQSTPTRVGKALGRFALKVTTGPKRKMLSALFTQEDDTVDVLVREYVDFVSQHPEIKAVDRKKGVQNMGRCIHVASYIPLSPPSATLIVDKQEMLALLFARDVKYIYSCMLTDNRDLEEVTAAVGKTLNSFIIEFKSPDKSAQTSVVRTQSPATHLVYRFLGLSKCRSAAIDVPENSAWLFLYLHQLIYEKTAITYPTESGMHGRTKQQIQTAVNRDINALCNAKFGAGALSKNDKANNKVSPPGLLLTFPEIYVIPPQVVQSYRQQAE